jgi:hypothetical protein
VNWKLILALSLFGVVVAFLSLLRLGIFEFVIWLAIFVLYAVIIARRAAGKYFLHGFLISIVNSVWVTAVHEAFFSTYVRNNPQMVQGTPPGINPRIVMIVAGPIVGAVMGVIAGSLALIASKLLSRIATGAVT